MQMYIVEPRYGMRQQIRQVFFSFKKRICYLLTSFQFHLLEFLFIYHVILLWFLRNFVHVSVINE